MTGYVFNNRSSLSFAYYLANLKINTICDHSGSKEHLPRRDQLNAAACTLEQFAGISAVFSGNRSGSCSFSRAKTT